MGVLSLSPHPPQSFSSSLGIPPSRVPFCAADTQDGRRRRRGPINPPLPSRSLPPCIFAVSQKNRTDKKGVLFKPGGSFFEILLHYFHSAKDKATFENELGNLFVVNSFLYADLWRGRIGDRRQCPR